MSKLSTSICFIFIFFTLLFSHCTQNPTNNKTAITETSKTEFGGFQSQEKWGQHLITIAGCNDCHTPKIITPNGLELDSSLLLSGHPAGIAYPDANREEIETKGLSVTHVLTSWIGPWGVSYAANLTSDPTGIGYWKEENFITAMREGKFNGVATARTLLPPMPWQMYKNMTDDELKAIFAFLLTTKPIQNVVPQPLPPVLVKQ